MLKTYETKVLLISMGDLSEAEQARTGEPLLLQIGRVFSSLSRFFVAHPLHPAFQICKRRALTRTQRISNVLKTRGLSCFQDRSHQPLGHLSSLYSFTTVFFRLSGRCRSGSNIDSSG
jgi:hypothetical protein